MIVTKETKIIVSSPSRTQDLCFGKRRLNFCASRWLVEVSLEVVRPPYGPFMRLLFSLRNYVLLAVLRVVQYSQIVLAYRKEDIHMSCCCLLVNHNKQNEHDSDALPFNFNVRTMFVILAAP